MPDKLSLTAAEVSRKGRDDTAVFDVSRARTLRILYSSVGRGEKPDREALEQAIND